MYECNSNYQEVWITTLTMYKIILLMYGIYLAWIIRNVNVPSMNDSKYLLLSTYAIIICGLGSMTLTQLLKDWPDVVHVFFTLGILLATCITQCLVFIPKIRLWYKRRHDDNFKISLSQVFLNPPTSCYFSGKNKPSGKNKSANQAQDPEAINLEDELCQLLHENSQLKNFLKEKEEIIKLLQNKVRVTKASFFQQSKDVAFLNNNDTSFSTMTENKTQDSGITDSIALTSSQSKSLLLLNEASSVTATTLMTNNTQLVREQLNCDNELRFPVNKAAFKNDSVVKPSSTYGTSFGNTYTEQLKNDLDEVEALTSRVRDSISVDLSNTRRYSPLLYEYYRKQLELAKSIQCTYNIQCNSLFDAMTLMRSCLKDYCQTVHNPEYLAIESLNMNDELTQK